MKRERERDGISLGTSNKLPEQFKYVRTEVGLFHGQDFSIFSVSWDKQAKSLALLNQLSYNNLAAVIWFKRCEGLKHQHYFLENPIMSLFNT